MFGLISAVDERPPGQPGRSVVGDKKREGGGSIISPLFVSSFEDKKDDGLVSRISPWSLGLI